MATTRRAETIWTGTLLEGSGETTFVSSGIGTFPVSWPSRSEDANGKTSPEEFLAAAHASCFSMALSSALAKAGTPATSLQTQVEVDFQPGQGVTEIRISVRGDVPDVDQAAFEAFATGAKENCPISKALSAVPMVLTATLN
ncbi:MAG: OsmC family peroxiredoxin [Acidobacteria bacterium]|nr:OsmC family peroxiredoxin [Acidobacteriota bacterium]